MEENKNNLDSTLEQIPAEETPIEQAVEVSPTIETSAEIKPTADEVQTTNTPDGPTELLTLPPQEIVPAKEKLNLIQFAKKNKLLSIIVSSVLVIALLFGIICVAYNASAIDISDYITVYLEQDGEIYDAKTISLDYEAIAIDHNVRDIQGIQDIFEYVQLTYKEKLEFKTYDENLGNYPKGLSKLDCFEIGINWNSLARGNIEKVKDIEKELGIRFNHSDTTVEIYVNDIIKLGNVEDKKPDFKELYEKFCNSKWAEVAEDGSYLKLDSNPSDYDDDSYLHSLYTYFSDVDRAVEQIHEFLGVPDSVISKMDDTTWSMGVQREEYNTFDISWTYHPDKGFEVTYELKAN